MLLQSPALRSSTPRSPGEPCTDSPDFQALVHGVRDYAIVLLDPSGCIRSWNEGACELSGYQADEVLGRSVAIFHPFEPGVPNPTETGLAIAAERGRFEDEGWRQGKGTRRFWANVVTTRMLDSQGRLQGFSQITRNLTPRREQEEALRQNEERLRLLVDTVRDYAIFMLDADGHVRSWNVGAEHIKGYRADEILGRHFSTFYPQAVIDAGWPTRELEIAQREGRVEDEGWRLRKDGSRFWASVVITALRDPTGTLRGFTKITRDLTDRRRILELQDEGRRMTTFLAMLGHELRNPLAPIANAVSLMHLEQIESPVLRRSRDVIDRQLGQLARLVDDLLDVGRISSGKVHLDRQAVSLREVVAQALEAVAPQMQSRRHQVLRDLENTELWVRGDWVRLVQVLSNLLNNAAKFTPAGGRITVRLRRCGTHAELGVKDNGPGVAPEALEDIFNLFVQAPQDAARSAGGLGLGLSLVQQLVRRMDGHVSAFSTGVAGEGAEFIVRLPLIEPPAPTLSPAAAPAAVQPKRILVVDDNRDGADSMAVLLEALGYAVDVCYDGRSALDALRRQAPDLALIDVGLPDVDGRDVARQVQAQVEHPPPMLAMTGYGQEADRCTCLEAGFSEHLVKPLRLETLAPVLARWLAGALPRSSVRMGGASPLPAR